MTEMSGVPGFPVYQQPVRPGWQRPGLTTTAAVLGFVQAGLAIFGGLITLVAALGSVADEGDLRSGTDPLGAEIVDNLALTTIVGALVVLGSGVTIAGSVLLTSGRDRIFYLAGMALQLAFCVLYFTLGAIAAHRIEAARGPFGRPENPAYGFMVIAVFFAVLPILGLVFASVRTTTEFLRAKSDDPNLR